MDRGHAESDLDYAQVPSGVTVRSDSSAARFLQQNQAVAATLDASTIAIRPEHAGSDAVLTHEYAHIAQLRSGLTASRVDAERRAGAAHGSLIDVGGAATLPMFQTIAATSTDLEPAECMFKLEIDKLRYCFYLGYDSSKRGTIPVTAWPSPDGASGKPVIYEADIVLYRKASGEYGTKPAGSFKMYPQDILSSVPPIFVDEVNFLKGLAEYERRNPNHKR